MMGVNTDTGWGLMCPNCCKVIRADETGLRPLLEASDLAFLCGWVYDENESGYVCDTCARMGPPDFEPGLGRIL